MRLEKEASPFSSMGMLQLVVTALVYTLFAFLGQKCMTALGGWQLDFADFVPVVAGILFGLPGAFRQFSWSYPCI